MNIFKKYYISKIISPRWQCVSFPQFFCAPMWPNCSYREPWQRSCLPPANGGILHQFPVYQSESKYQWDIMLGFSEDLMFPWFDMTWKSCRSSALLSWGRCVSSSSLPVRVSPKTPERKWAPNNNRHNDLLHDVRHQCKNTPNEAFTILTSSDPRDHLLYCNNLINSYPR